MRKSAVQLTLLALVVLLTAAAGALLVGSRGFCAGDNWYADGNGHWATQYIYLLWQEGVTDGERSATKERVFYYWPNSKITRAQFTTLLFKVFQMPSASPEEPSYPDVPKTYCILYDKPAWEFIEGALAGGISFVPAGSDFSPDRLTTREDAVEFLIRSLDLTSYAGSLPPEEVQTILVRFRDWREVSSERRAAMACAIKLGIIDGYEDWSLRPLRYMSRAEAAVVVCRSCLIRVTARSDWFSPDGDGVDDRVAFDVTYLKNRGIKEWQVDIVTESGSPVYQFNWNSDSGSPPMHLVWDGRNRAGVPVPRGKYYYQGWVKDNSGRIFTSVAKPLLVEMHSLSASLSPSRCVDGHVLHVWASTIPKADSVTVSFAGGFQKRLTSPDAGSSWQTQMVMGPPIHSGPQVVEVTAAFPRAVRSVSIPLNRVEEAWLTASVLPNPAAWGQVLVLSCRASDSVQLVRVSLFGSQLQLSRSSSGTWTGTLSVPWDLPGGIYPAVFTGNTNDGQVMATVPVDIRSPKTAELLYVLSK